MIGPEEGLEQLRNTDIEKTSPLQTVIHFFKGKCYDHKGQWKKAQAQYLKTLSLLNQFPDLEETNLKAATYHELGRCCYYQNNLEQALHYIEKGLESYNKSEDREYILYHLMISKAIYLEKLNRNEEANRTLEIMWKNIDKIDSIEIRLSMYEVQSVLLNKQELYERATQFALRGIQMARLDLNVDRSFELWTALGESYKNLGDFFKAEICFRTALKLENRIRKKNILVSTYTKLGMLYLMTKKIPLAQNALLKAVQIGQKTNDALKNCDALIALGDCYMKQNKDSEARSCLQQAYNLAEKHNLKNLLPDILVKLAKCCEREDPLNFEKYKNLFFQHYVQQLEKGGEKG
jgi:tetratricopeptide (TPR) repeat protein